MSLKVDTFKGFIQYPKTVDKYLVVFMDYPSMSFSASEATIPTQEYTEDTIWWCGKPMKVPTSQQESGVFTCTLIEDVKLSVARFITMLQHRFNGTGASLQEIQVCIMDQFTGAIPIQKYVIKDAYLQKYEPKPLKSDGATEVMSYQLTFHYSYSSRSL